MLRGLRAGGGGRFGVTWGKEAGGGAEGKLPPPTGALGGFAGGAPLAPELDIGIGWKKNFYLDLEPSKITY